MNNLKFVSTTLAVLLTITLIISCTYTQSYPPDMNNDKLAIVDTLKQKYGFEQVTFLAKKISGSNGKHTNITIRFINGNNIPTNETQITALAKQLGSKVKNVVKNPSQYESFTILFDKVEVDGAVTKENYTGHEFKTSDL